MTSSKLALLAALLTCAACQTSGGTTAADLVDLYDRADPNGIIEIEMDRDGRVLEMEADIPIADLPPAVRAAALAAAPGGTITGAEREIKAGNKAWEVKITLDARGWEFVVDDAGTILETEKELSWDEAPPAVLDGADRAVPKGVRLSVEVIERGDVTEYHVKKTDGATRYKIVVAPNGTVLRAVREQPAEIEIPLAR